MQWQPTTTSLFASRTLHVRLSKLHKKTGCRGFLFVGLSIKRVNPRLQKTGKDTALLLFSPSPNLANTVAEVGKKWFYSLGSRWVEKNEKRKDAWSCARLRSSSAGLLRSAVVCLRPPRLYPLCDVTQYLLCVLQCAPPPSLQAGNHDWTDDRINKNNSTSPKSYFIWYLIVE